MTKKRGFVLLEVMIGVMIFSLGLLALGRCVNNCVIAESVRQESERARLALENRMAQIEAGEIPTDKAISENVGDSFPGMKIKQVRRAVEAKNEKGNEIKGLYEMDLEVDWTTDNEPQSSNLSFYVLRSR